MEQLAPIALEDTISVPFIYHCRGKQQHLNCHNVYEADAKYINKNNLVLSMEELQTGDIAVYLRAEEQDEDEETMTVSYGRSCQDTLQELVKWYKDKQNV